jgi:hypothetical protein
MNRTEIGRLLEAARVRRLKSLLSMSGPTARAMSALRLREPQLSTLGVAERAFVTFRYGTCFTTQAWRLEFRGPAPVDLVAYEMDPFKRAAPSRCLGRKTLRAPALRKLDRAIAFYRSDRRGYLSWTAGTTLTISWARKRGRRRESHNDNSMALRAVQYRNVLPFEELLRTVAMTPNHGVQRTVNAPSKGASSASARLRVVRR